MLSKSQILSSKVGNITVTYQYKDSLVVLHTPQGIVTLDLQNDTRLGQFAEAVDDLWNEVKRIRSL